jgi:hypothetical protein
MININIIKNFYINKKSCVPFCKLYNNILQKHHMIFKNIDQIYASKYKTISKELSNFLKKYNIHVAKIVVKYSYFK